MDTRLRCEVLPTVIVFLGGVCLRGVVCQVYSWSVTVPLNITLCTGSSGLSLNWTYTPPSPDPSVIEWSKQNVIFDNIATYDGASLIPSAAYTGRVNRTGSTAEIAIQGPPTTADGGLYRVIVTDSSAVQITAYANVIVPAVIVPIKASCKGTDAGGYTVTCSVEVTPPVTLELRNSTGIINSGSSVNELQTPISNAANLTFQCSVTGDGSECVTPSTADVTCVPDNTTPTPSGSTTPPSTSDDICKDNDLCYLFVLLLIPLLILIGLLVWWCMRNKKDVKSDQGDETKMAETKMDKTKMDETKPNLSAVQQRL